MPRTQSDLKSWFWVAVFLGLLVIDNAYAQGDLRPQDLQSGSLLLRMQQGYSVATRLNTDVSLEVNGLVARVAVRQSFQNTSDDWVEGIYVFPLPDKAAVDRLRLHIGERFIEGEIQEKEQAKETYERAKSEGRKASLVEQQRANLFTTAVANIAPGEQVVVEIEYLEDVRYQDGTFSLRFPMTLTPRYVPGASLPDRRGSGWSADTDRVPDGSAITPPQVSASEDHRITLQGQIDAGLPLDAIESRYHPIRVRKRGSQYAISFAEDSVAMDHDLELVWRPQPSAAPRALVFREDQQDQAHLLLLVMPPDAELVPDSTMPREMLLIVDTSGSMHGVSINQAKAAVKLAVAGLNPGDLFNVIEFNSVTRQLFPRSQLASHANRRLADTFIDRLQANGGTEMRPALEAALRSAPSETHLRQIVFITDGSVGYEAEMFSLIESELGSSRLFTVGIGSAPNSWFMRKSAELGKGTYTFISALHEVQEKMEQLFSKLRQPQVTDIEVRWPSGVTAESFPAVVPDLYAGEPVVVKAKLSGQLRTSDVVTVSGNTIAGAWNTGEPLAVDTDSEGIGALWARARIADLVDAERRTAMVAELRDEIVAVALQYHLVSKYTSLVAVDKTPARVAAQLRREQVPNLMPYGQSMTAAFGFPATATPAPLLRLTGVLTLLLALALFWSGRWRGQRRAA